MTAPPTIKPHPFYNHWGLATPCRLSVAVVGILRDTFSVAIYQTAEAPSMLLLRIETNIAKLCPETTPPQKLGWFQTINNLYTLILGRGISQNIPLKS